MKLEKSVYKLVVAEVGDYERMRRMVESGNLSREQIVGFTRKMTAIEDALSVVCEGECLRARRALMDDIANETGYDKSESKAYYPARATFVRRKKEAIERIATMLGLV